MIDDLLREIEERGTFERPTSHMEMWGDIRLLCAALRRAVEGLDLICTTCTAVQPKEGYCRCHQGRIEALRDIEEILKGEGK